MGYLGNQITTVFPTSISVDSATISGNASVGGTSTLTGAVSTGTSLTVANGLTLSDGNMTLANGHGIDFSATSDASGQSSELLSDYEEGTWTPNIGGNATYTNQTAQYVKVGDVVHVQCNIEINAIGTGSANTLSGLPYTSFNNLHVQTVNIAYYASIATSMIWLSGYVENNANSIKFSGNTTSNTTIQHNTNNVFQNNARVILTATYRIA